jgi:hypothetical protein
MPELGIEPWKLVVLFIAILILRRIPALLLIYKFVPEIETWREALFSGHFGMSISFIMTFEHVADHRRRTCKCGAPQIQMGCAFADME